MNILSLFDKKNKKQILINTYQMLNNIKIGPNIAKIALLINNSIIPQDKDTIIYRCQYCKNIHEEKVQSIKKKILIKKIICRNCKTKETNLNKYGFDHPVKSKQIRNKIEKTCLSKYGMKIVLCDINKMKQGMIDKFGVENALQLKQIKDKIIATNLKKYGVENPSQDSEIHKKQMSGFGHAMRMKEINKNLHYQNKKELQLIEYCKDNNIKIFDGPKIKYKWNNKDHFYFSNFETEKYIIEIKASHYWYKQDLKNGKIDAKNKAAREYANLINKEYLFLLDICSYEGIL